MWISCISSVHAQSSGQFSEVTFTCQNLNLETALEKISQKSGVFFIYSPSLLDLTQTVSLAVQRQPLNQVLSKLGSQLNLTFRYEGKYVIIKRAEVIVKKEESKGATTGVYSASIGSTISKHFSLSAVNTPRNYEYLSHLPKISPIEIKSPELTPLKPLAIIQPEGITHNQWFVSAGLVTNDYAIAGTEIRGGLKPLFAVVNFNLLDQNRYRIGYGIGTGASLFDKVSVNLIYNYGSVHGPNEVALIKENNQFSLEKNYTVSMKHNQLKLMVQYDIHPNFYLTGGASFNLLKTNYQLQSVFHSINIISPYKESGSLVNSIGYGGATFQGEVLAAPLRPLRSDFQTTHTWVGWEFGAFYRINFK